MSQKQNEYKTYNNYESMSTANPVNGIMSEVAPDFDFGNIVINERRMPIVPVRNIVMFPFITVPLSVTDPSVLDVLDMAQKNNEAVLSLTVRSDNEKLTSKDFYRIGVACVVARIMEMPDGSYTAFMVAANRVKANRITSKENGFFASVEFVPEIIPEKEDMELAALFSSVRDSFSEILGLFSEEETKEIRFALTQFSSPLKLVNFIISNSPLTLEDKQKLLEESDIKARCSSLLHMLDTAFQMLQLKVDIQERTREDISKQQRDQFLQQQLRAIKEELGDNPEESDEAELTAKAEKMQWSKEMESHFIKELKKLGRFMASTPEYGIQYTYLNTLLSLPWDKKRETPVDLNHVEEILNRDHFGLDKIKDRILEQVAVMKLRGDMKAPILCLYGPPGVGKTSLGKSVAEALGREYARISLGGLHDEAEIRGHRRTYIGAMPGRIIAALEKTESNNPVIVLDEIDKISKDIKGDPSAALLEVLDPEQNSHFHDNYIDVDYNLSDVLFIATANTLDSISAPLLDRMELIEVSGYIIEEKIEIAKRHLLPKALEDLGFEKDDVKISDDGIRQIVEHYTRESGVRMLDKAIRRLLRRLARLKATDRPLPELIGAEEVKQILGKEEHVGEVYEGNDFVGVVTGLAWTASGGEILFIESSLSKGKGEKLTLTGNLGDVMKESATIALEYVRAHSAEFGIDDSMFTEYNVHIHVPEGAIPKDGPSAGITMVTSLISAFTGKKVRERVAMTGEMTLRGKVLPVGGIKEKILAAKRAGITDIIISKENSRDIDEIEPIYVDGLKFLYVNRIDDVISYAI
ncbi:MAG: endopeptidase La, partial [Muribaculaceae bacterium]|nr:endopeptidase La [Muribaculaceae bacterium]